MPFYRPEAMGHGRVDEEQVEDERQDDTTAAATTGEGFPPKPLYSSWADAVEDHAVRTILADPKLDPMEDPWQENFRKFPSGAPARYPVFL